MDTKEEWRDIKGYKGDYQVSNLGRVKSLKQIKERIMKPSNSKRYLTINLSKSDKKKTFEVHQLVAIAFLDHTPCGHKQVVDHIDNNPLNNHANNLQIIRHRENVSKGRNRSLPTGVYATRHGRFYSLIYINGKQFHLGTFPTPEEASEAYQARLSEYMAQ